MIEITFEKTDAEGLHMTRSHWPAVPRIGEVVEFNDGAVITTRIHGVVKRVVWWANGSVRVVLR